MIKSRLYVECQTNKLTGMPQENVYFQGIFRKPEDYSNSFIRSSETNSGFQVSAVFSAQGPDSMAATALQKIAKTFSETVDRALSAPTPDVNQFSADIVQSLSNVVYAFSLAKMDISLKVSFTASIIFEDMLYIISLGNTRAYLLHDRKWIPLTEDDTIANQRLKKGELSREEAQKHPDSDALTQYIGMPLQDGRKLVPTKARYKLSANDEVYLLGVGVIKYVPESIMAFIMSRDVDLTIKTSEALKAAVDAGAKGGLSAVSIRIDALTSSAPTVQPLVPALAGIPAPIDDTARFNLGNSYEAEFKKGTEDDPWNETTKEQIDIKHSERGRDMPVKTKSKWKKRLGAILLPIILFALFALIGYFTTYAVLNWRKVEVKADPSASSTVNQEESLNKVMYSLSDNVSVLSGESTDSEVLQVLSRGEPVKLITFGPTFAKVETASGNAGYVLSLMLSELDPTIGEEVVEMTADPTPIPDFTQPPATQATEPPETVEETEATEPSETTETTTTETTAAETTAAETTAAETTAAETTAAETTAAETTAAETTAAETTAAETTAAETTVA
jgi:serine/threonine protein phosphatase PrpC